jgi:hypothetical protein
MSNHCINLQQLITRKHQHAVIVFHCSQFTNHSFLSEITSCSKLTPYNNLSRANNRVAARGHAARKTFWSVSMCV